MSRFHECQLPNVSSLDMSSNMVVAFLIMLPNLQAIDFSMSQLGVKFCRFIVQHCASQTLQEVTWNGSFLKVDLAGLEYNDEAVANSKLWWLAELVAS